MFRHLIPDEKIVEIYNKARKFYNKHIIHLNATYQGGGVAEMLYPLAQLMNDVGIMTGWRILHGSQEFFEVTKSFHNALQGAPLKLTSRKKNIYIEVNDNFSKFAHLYHDCVIIHDPQPLPLINCYKKNQPWIWRCHIDLTNPHAGLWDFLKDFLLQYDQMVVSSEKFKKPDLPIPQRIIYPAINPLSPKNREMSQRAIIRQITRLGIPTDKPVICQVSRLDPWKDPEGVVDVFERVKENVDCRLVLCYNVATDDPEGLQMYRKVRRKAAKYIKSGDVHLVVGNTEFIVNAVQRFSDVIIQKSIREGFCLTVTEALWKGTPVVASNIGGIPVQIEDGKNGYLLEPMDNQGFADRIIHILKNPEEKNRMGIEAKETVRNKFLITRLLSDYLDMLRDVMCD